MFKKMTVAALASVMISAFAQDNATPNNTMSITTTYDANHPWRAANEYFDPNGKSLWTVEKHVERYADKYLNAGDAYRISDTLSRVPLEIESALVFGLADAHLEAVNIEDRMLAMRFPQDSTTTITTSNTGSGTTTTTTTTTNMASNIDWSSDAPGSRAMRMVMTSERKPKDIDYNEAIDILCSRISDSQAAVLRDWWYSGQDDDNIERSVTVQGATEAQKDAIVRLLKVDASMADDVYYPSVYMHRTYSWINQ